ncbi:MAG: SufE family protein [Planctomycetaceae bacterium]
MAIEELIEEFQDLGDWADQCELLIDMGRELPVMPAHLKTEASKVHGCQSNVWLVANLHEGPLKLELIADSDAMIVRGLLSIILMVYSNRSPQEILETDVQDIFGQLGLDRHLSSARKNGLAGMVRRVRAVASEATG